MEREQDTRLQELKDAGITVYSFSRLGTINNCLYEAYKTYVEKAKGDQNIYAVLGSRCHDVLEAIVNNKATEADLLPAMKQELEDVDLFGIEFPKDARGNDSIREGWIADMTHFCETYKSPKKNLKTEELFIYKTPKDRYLQGYIDLQHINSDGSVSIYDYKTSSMYTGAAVLEHSRQLTLYALGLEQAGFKVKNVAWIFLKYVDITYDGYKTAKSKTKTSITKTVERRKIASEMAKVVEQDLYENGYDEVDADVVLQEFKATNKFDCLPECIRYHYVMKPCVYDYPLTDESREECIKYIDDTIDAWEALNTQDTDLFKPRSFTKVQKNGKIVGDYFYCTNLCGHFKTCPYIHDYLDQLEANKQSEDDDLF